MRDFAEGAIEYVNYQSSIGTLNSIEEKMGGEYGRHRKKRLKKAHRRIKY